MNKFLNKSLLLTANPCFYIWKDFIYNIKKEYYMRDINMAIEFFKKENLSLAIVKNSKVIFKSNQKGT